MSRLMIGKVSEITGCGIETIRYYEKENMLPSPGRTSGGHRIYTDGMVDRIVFIRRCRELGFSILEVREFLSLVDQDHVSCEKVKSLTKKHMSDIQSKINDLTRMQNTLKELSDACSGLDVPECPIIDALQSRQSI